MSKGKKKGKESKARLLSAAAAEFSQKGFHEAKISTIVAEAGLTQPAFYIYYSSKDSIFQELVGEFRARIRKLISSSRLDRGMEKRSISESIQASLTHIFTFFLAEQELTRIGLFIDPENAKIKAEVTAMIKENLLAEQQEGYFRSNLEMGFVAECLMGLIERITTTLLSSESGPGSPKHLASQVVDLLLLGML